ncbi:MAG: TlpA family protein disulfide reductase [Acidobacteria bacterium]|nr:TlpA family protein disulfide reductase [Acidobacteriota bacterium]
MSKITIAKWVVVGLAGVVILWLVLRPHSHGPVVLGDSAPAFTLPRLPSGNLSLRDFRGKVVILNFWATWCPPCVMETPSLEKFYSELKSDGVSVIGVSVDQSGQQLRQFVKEYHLTYPIARDPNAALAHRYGTYKFPETYIIGRDGHVAEKIIGTTDWVDPRMIAFVKSLTNNRQASR